MRPSNLLAPALLATVALCGPADLRAEAKPLFDGKSLDLTTGEENKLAELSGLIGEA
jgi:hypothetical protein